MTDRIQEHEAPIEGEAKIDNQTAEETKAVNLAESLYQKGKEHRSNYDQRWMEFYKFFRGKQWRERRPSYRHSEVLNFTFAAIQSIIPILTDKRPNIFTLPQEPSDIEFAKIMTLLLTSKWDRDQYAMTLADCIIDSSIYGTGFGSVEWYPEMDKGLGDYNFESEDLFYMYPDPDAVDVNDRKAKFFVKAEPVSVAQVKREYPLKAHLISSDVATLEDAKIERTALEDNNRYYKSATDASTLVDTGRKPDSTNEDAKVLKITAWILPEEEIEQKIEKSGKDGKPVEVFEKRKLFPNGRKIVIANKVLLEDGPNQYEDGKFPFARLLDYSMPREFWGVGEVENLMDPQRLINKIMSYIMDVMILMGNPIWKIPADSGIDTDSVINSPGLVLEHNPGAEPKRERGVDLNPYILQTYDRLQDIFRTISGVSEVSQGATPSSGASGVSIELLQDASQTKLRLKSRNVDSFLTQIGELMVSRTLQYYTSPRVFRITNDESSNKYFRFSVDEDEQKNKEVVITEFTPIKEDDTLETVGFQEGATTRLSAKNLLDVKVESGSSLPLQKAQAEQKAFKFFELGIFDEEDLLNAIEVDNKEQLLIKIQQRKEQQAALAEQEAAAGVQPQPRGV
jgi:hypothetical protein